MPDHRAALRLPSFAPDLHAAFRQVVAAMGPAALPGLPERNFGNFICVGQESLWDIWRDLCPDPNLILIQRLPDEKFHG